LITRTFSNYPGLENINSLDMMWNYTGPSLWGHTTRASHMGYIRTPNRLVVDRQLLNLILINKFQERPNGTTSLILENAIALMLNINDPNYGVAGNQSPNAHLMQTFQDLTELRLINFGQLQPPVVDTRMMRYIDAYDPVTQIITPNMQVFGIPAIPGIPPTTIHINEVRDTYHVHNGVSYRNDLMSPDKVIHFVIQDFLDVTTMIINAIFRTSTPDVLNQLLIYPENIREVLFSDDPPRVECQGTAASQFIKRNRQVISIKDGEIILKTGFFDQPREEKLIFEPAQGVIENLNTPNLLSIPYTAYRGGGNDTLTSQTYNMYPRLNVKTRNASTRKPRNINQNKQKIIMCVLLSKFIYFYLLYFNNILQKNIKNVISRGKGKSQTRGRSISRKGKRNSNFTKRRHHTL
jgi:hypothetical protein